MQSAISGNVGRVLKDQSQLGKLRLCRERIVRISILMLTCNSFSYVDQIELQQKILIKALKQTWSRWAPTELRLQTGPDPSIHTIVRALDAVQGTTGQPKQQQQQHHIPADFTFNEILTDRDSGDDDAAFDRAVPSFDTIPTFSTTTTSSRTSTLEAEPVFSHKDSMSTVSSRAHSIAASTRSSVDSCSPLSIKVPSVKTERQQGPSPTNKSASRPTFCPLPSRPDTVPIVPTRFDLPDIEPMASCDEYRPPSFPMLDWQTNNINSINSINNVDFDTSLLSPTMGLDFTAYHHQNGTPEAWNS